MAPHRAPTPHPVAPEAGALTSPNRATSALPPPQSLSRCHLASRERLTIIPHGVPYMTKLLRYFVSEDSIFLHLEHVQGGGPLGCCPLSSPLKCQDLGRGRLAPGVQPRAGAQPCRGVQAGQAAVGLCVVLSG